MGCWLSTALRCSAMSISPICSSARRWAVRRCRAVFSGNCRSHTSTGTQAGAETRAGGLSSTAHTVIGPATDDGNLDRLEFGPFVSGIGLGGVADRVADAQT